MIAEIFELKDILEQKNRLMERENKLSSPTLDNLDLIPEIYGWFNELHGGKNTVYCRKQFIFIILLLYAPIVLVGGRMPKGLRNSIAKAAGFKDITFISHNVNTVFFYYRYYRGFRKDIDRVYNEITNRLKLKGLINNI